MTSTLSCIYIHNNDENDSYWTKIPAHEQHASIQRRRHRSMKPHQLPKGRSTTPAERSVNEHVDILNRDVSRLRSTINDWIIYHQASTLITLTFAYLPTRVPDQLNYVADELANFRRRCAYHDVLNPLLMVRQFGEVNNRIHFHGASSQEIDAAKLKKLWKKGETTVDEMPPQSVSSYLTKNSELGRSLIMSGDTYSVTRGSAPPAPQVTEHASLHDAQEEVFNTLGTDANLTWVSGEDFAGPPTMMYRT